MFITELIVIAILLPIGPFIATGINSFYRKLSISYQKQSKEQAAHL